MNNFNNVFKNSDKNHKGFKALKRCLSLTKLNVKDEERTGYMYIGNIEYRTFQDVLSLRELGYKSTECAGVNVKWVSGNKIHYVSVRLDNFKNNYFKIFHTIDKIYPEEMKDERYVQMTAYQAS